MTCMECGQHEVSVRGTCSTCGSGAMYVEDNKVDISNEPVREMFFFVAYRQWKRVHDFLGGVNQWGVVTRKEIA